MHVTLDQPEFYMTHWITTLFNSTYPFELPVLNFAYDALENHIDTTTMTIHHTKHHQTYVTQLNKGLEQHPEFQQKTLEWLVKNWETLPASLKNIVKNHGGGHLNHALFWKMLSPTPQHPSSTLENALQKDFGSLEQFTTTFNTAATSVFGSGWAWLCIKDGKLLVLGTANQENPITQNMTPLLGLDVWEHAYYLKYQNQRAAYINAFWNVINWQQVEELLERSQKTKN